MTQSLFDRQVELKPRLVGRDAQLAELDARLDAACGGRGSVVVLRGAEGMGKTRLAGEMAARAAARDVLFLRGDTGGGSPAAPYGFFAPVLAALFRLLGEGECQGLRQVLAAVAPHLLAAGDRRAHSAEPSPETNPDLQQVLFMAGTARSLSQLAARRPLVLCLEDVQCADTASLKLIHYIARRCAESPLLLLVSLRPQEAGGAGVRALAPLLRDMSLLPHCTQVELPALSLAQVRRLMGSCFPASGFGEGLVGLIHERTGGVPLFVLQFLEQLRGCGVLYRRRGLWLNRPVFPEEVPLSPAEAVRARLQALGREEVRLLGWAAVQGERFDGGLLARALGWPVERVEPILEQMARRTFLIQHCADCFRFAHVFVGKACYGSLCGEERRRAHLHTARAAADAPAEFLAHHYDLAGARRRALPYLVEAARTARAAAAYWEARGFFARALGALADAARREECALRQQIRVELAEVDDRLGESARAEALCRQVLRDDGVGGEVAGRALLQLGWCAHRRGDWREASGHYTAALRHFAHADLARWQAVTQVRLGNIDVECGRLDEAASRFRDVWPLAERLGNAALMGTIRGNLGVLASMRGACDEALENYGEALRVYQQAGYRYGIAQTYHNLGMTYAASGRSDEALACYGEGEQLARQMGTMDVVANILVSRAALQVQRGELEEAESSCAAARHYMADAEDHLGLAECDKIEGFIWQGRGECERAVACLQRGLEVFAALDNALGAGECERALGQVRCQMGAVEAARAHLDRALAHFARVGAADDWERTARAREALDG